MQKLPEALRSDTVTPVPEELPFLDANPSSAQLGVPAGLALQHCPPPWWDARPSWAESGGDLPSPCSGRRTRSPGFGGAGPKCWAVRAVDGGVEAERLRPKHSLGSGSRRGTRSRDAAVGREPTWEGSGLGLGVPALASPGRSEVPSNCTARVHLKYGLPSPSSASRVRSLRVA